MDLRRIRYFLVLARTLNFSQAARELKVSQPALSKAIKQLEAEFGGSLIRREGRLSHLTHLGERMRASLQQVEDASLRAEQLASRLTKTETACIRIAVMCTIDPGKVSECLAEFQQKFPGLAVELLDATAESIQDVLLDGKIDIAILGSPVEAVPRLRVHELFQEEMIIACGVNFRLASRSSIPLKKLTDYPYLDRLRCEFREMVVGMTDAHDVELNVVTSSEREDWIKSLLMQNHGVSIMPTSSAKASGLVTVKFQDVELHRSVFLTIPSGREDQPAVQALVKHAREYNWEK
ncbi:LysR family transcriptional regulator [Parasedimentitalea marina]|uniref:LysR family transcriptional regulator n=1 Tax=Parasedimentitalea marina TaxID=2483033 RepID=A0A3T0N116_9RHOB|nr:LysR family transcriptional regulator [Parasedimentitalea marina]AZV77705.1 LysR family transcriptional regulator [Parasedimentitalea marina]